MLLSCVTLFLAVCCCASAGSEDGDSPSPRNSHHSVLRKVIAGPAGAGTVITVSGSLQWKETIKVDKSTVISLEEIRNYFFEDCCLLPSNQTQDETTRKCLEAVKDSFPEEVAIDEASKARRQLTQLNCIIQCISYRSGLSDKNGNIMPEEMVSFILSDSRTAMMGIPENMIKGCINTAKAKGLELLQSDEEINICVTSNVEMLKFVKCMVELENLYCPADYLRHSKYCDKSRRMMKKQMRFRAEDKKINY